MNMDWQSVDNDRLMLWIMHEFANRFALIDSKRLAGVLPVLKSRLSELIALLEK